MTTSTEKHFTCEICYEDKPYHAHTFCSNGHLGGCQKCHMELVKTAYKSDLFVHHKGSNVGRCMFCREKMGDLQMGESWGKKLLNIQPICMWLKSKEMFGDDFKPTLQEVLDDYRNRFLTDKHRLEDLKSQEVYKYIGLWDDISLQRICSLLNDLENDALFDNINVCDDFQKIQKIEVSN